MDAGEHGNALRMLNDHRGIMPHANVGSLEVEDTDLNQPRLFFYVRSDVKVGMLQAKQGSTDEVMQLRSSGCQLRLEECSKGPQSHVILPSKSYTFSCKLRVQFRIPGSIGSLLSVQSSVQASNDKARMSGLYGHSSGP